MMHAINDWLEDRHVDLDTYRHILHKMVDEAHDIQCDVVMMTESPILGSQYSGDHYYEHYIDAFRQVAESYPDVYLADANKMIKNSLLNGDPAYNARTMFDNNWHVSQIGHFIYLKAITNALGF